MIKHISGLIAYGLQIAKNQTEKVHFFDARYFEKSSASSLEACYLARWRNIEKRKWLVRRRKDCREHRRSARRLASRKRKCAGMVGTHKGEKVRWGKKNCSLRTALNLTAGRHKPESQYVCMCSVSLVRRKEKKRIVPHLRWVVRHDDYVHVGISFPASAKPHSLLLPSHTTAGSHTRTEVASCETNSEGDVNNASPNWLHTRIERSQPIFRG